MEGVCEGVNRRGILWSTEAGRWAVVGPAGGKSQRLAKQTLVRVHARLTAWY